MTSRRSVLNLGIAATAALAGIFLIDRRAAANEAQAETDFPPTGQFLRVDGARVHAHVQGSGPDLILIHGASGNTRDFTFGLVAALAARYRVIAFDRPGLGWSDAIGDQGLSPLGQALHLQKAAAQLGVTRPLILGQSYGAAVSMAWALSSPDPAALVLVSGATMPWKGRALGPWYEVAQTGIGGLTAVPLVAAFPPLEYARNALAAVASPEDPPGGYAEYIGLPLILRRESIRVNARQVGSLKAHIVDMMPRYPSVTQPVELLHGTADTIVFASVHSEPLSRLLPGSNLTLLSGAGHMAHHTRQTEVIAAIDRAAASAGLR
jgi:pimeloyl-ACP methyl ester carboxylesterase